MGIPALQGDQLAKPHEDDAEPSKESCPASELVPGGILGTLCCSERAAEKAQYFLGAVPIFCSCCSLPPVLISQQELTAEQQHLPSALQTIDLPSDPQAESVSTITECLKRGSGALFALWLSASSFLGFLGQREYRNVPLIFNES